MFLADGLACREARELADRIRRVGGFERAGQNTLDAHGLGGFARITAGTGEIEQARHAQAHCRAEHVQDDAQVGFQQARGMGAVQGDTPRFPGGDEDEVGLGGGDGRFDGCDIGPIGGFAGGKRNGGETAAADALRCSNRRLRPNLCS